MYYNKSQSYLPRRVSGFLYIIHYYQTIHVLKVKGNLHRHPISLIVIKSDTPLFEKLYIPAQLISTKRNCTKRVHEVESKSKLLEQRRGALSKGANKLNQVESFKTKLDLLKIRDNT